MWIDCGLRFASFSMNKVRGPALPPLEAGAGERYSPRAASSKHRLPRLQGHRPSRSAWWHTSEELLACAGRGWLKAPIGK